MISSSSSTLSPLKAGLDTKRTSSLADTARGYCVHAAHRLGYMTPTQHDHLETKVKRTSAALNGYIRSMREREA
jgi:hypothetical protein